ncbi:DNA-binding protein [Actinoplanes ianthinogenes]|uniref:DNA-binding protein n=1 Tax=Actinoplanes ianthinogenes TaxID=122358 RepID=A0ABN6CBR8_9ACTN|nr:TetR/AcrR family transcriptional regulator [Actinoplanes ianthinogenes]BCJ41798.1 DNA-binding protein [Actinoplanes ianthinogenes]GGR45029.1 DNA-binding protein [Actinoplanes ianthinogenes]
MSGVNEPRRRYRSPVREEAARRTRQAIVRAAGELFVSQGYARASLTAVAEEAGVARPTVTASFGSKAALLKQVLDEALAGDDEPVPVAQRPWFRPVFEARDPGAVLDAYAAVCVLIGGRAARLFETVRRAADDSEEAAQLWETLLTNRRFGARMVVEHAAGLGEPAPGRDLEAAIDSVWVYNDPALYGALVHRCGWSEEALQAWLATAMRAAVLRPVP